MIEKAFTEKLFSSQLDRLAEEFPLNDAITCENKTITYYQMKEYADAASLKLLRAGMKKGDKVILWGFNSIEWIISFWAVTQAGGIAVLMNYGLIPADVTALSRMVSASFGIIGDNAVTKKNPDLSINALVIGGVDEDHIFSINELSYLSNNSAKAEDIQLLVRAKKSVDRKDSQVIIFTTGSSSEPKAVLLSSFSILSDVDGIVDMIGLGSGDTFCLALPLYHSYGMIMALTYMAMGKHIYLSHLLKPDILINLIAENRVLDISSVGAVYKMMVNLPDFDNKIAGKIRRCVVGGSFNSPADMIHLEKKFNGAIFLLGYGQTECSPAISVEVESDPLENRICSVGHPFRNIDVKIMSDDRVFLPDGEVGEIVVKGPILMNGYLGLPEDEQPIDKNGWLHTGDLGRFNENGMLEFSGRIKDIINRGGENISPIEIERAILSEHGIREVKVMGCPHPIFGESVEACIVLKNDTFDEAKMREVLKNKLAPYKIPAHFFIYDAFPLSENGKLDQRRLRADMIERLSALRA